MGRFYSMILDEDGQGFIEYGLILSVISIAAIIILRYMGPQIAEMYNDIRLHEALDLDGANR